jgi:AraC-like DNA-binding protein
MPSATLQMNWPRVAVPVICSSGRFPMVAHDVGLVYNHPRTMALHLHDYAGSMWLGRRKVTLRPGDFTLTPAGMLTRYDLDATGHHLCVHVDALETTGEMMRLPLHWRPDTHERWLSERLWDIIHLYRRGETTAAVLARQAAGNALQSLLLWLAATIADGTTRRRKPGRVDGDLGKVRRHLDEHFREPLDVPALARRFGVSQNYLARRFRGNHGLTLQRYILSRRIEFARHLLNVTRMPLKAVAIESGLSNPQYFHRQFRLATGRSPSEERAQAAAHAAATYRPRD